MINSRSKKYKLTAGPVFPPMPPPGNWALPAVCHASRHFQPSAGLEKIKLSKKRMHLKGLKLPKMQ